MAEENQPPPPPPVEAGNPVQHNQLNELDTILSSHFKIQPEPFADEQPKAQSNPKENEPQQKSDPQAEKQPSEAPKDAPARNQDDNRPKEKSKSDLPDPEKIGDGKFQGNKAKQEGWEALRSNYKAAHRLASEREQEVIKLKKELADKGQGFNKEAETLKQQIAELNKYRAMVDIQADPEFINKFDKPLSTAKEDITSILKGFEVSDQTIKGLDFTDGRTMQHVIKWISENKSEFDADDFRSKVKDVISLTKERDKNLVSHKENYQKHLEERKKENFSKSAEEEGRTLGHLDRIIAARDAEQKPMFAFLNKQDIPEGANHSQVQQIEAHNNLVDKMSTRVKEVLSMNKPEDRAEVAVAAVASHYLNAQLKQAHARIQSLENEVKKISSVSDESPKTKARSGSNGQFKSNSEMNTDEALGHFMANR